MEGWNCEKNEKHLISFKYSNDRVTQGNFNYTIIKSVKFFRSIARSVFIPLLFFIFSRFSFLDFCPRFSCNVQRTIN